MKSVAGIRTKPIEIYIEPVTDFSQGCGAYKGIIIVYNLSIYYKHILWQAH